MQRGRTSGKPSPAATRGLDGTIAEIIYLPDVAANGGMVEARVVSGSRTTLVRLAPAVILKEKGLSLREGDPISLTGYMVNGMGDVLVAVEIRANGQRIALRDARGRLIE